MARLFLLDTNILIAALNGRPEVRERLERTPLSELRLSSIVLGELLFGAEKSAQSERNREKLGALAERLQIAGVDQDVARQYGRLRAHLEARGAPIGANDTWIAAQALSIGAILVTDNEREFSRAPGLRVENWLVR